MRLKVTIATTDPFENWGKQMAFSVSDLERMASTAEGVPVTVDFNRDRVIGRVFSAEVSEGKLVAEVEIKEKPFGDEPSFVVPATVYSHEEREHKKLTECAITLKPVQKLPCL
ncbi:hypothetical protein [Neptuniibacter pectenicola]|uniref:hypothetical protein n=1 Tax=Neptuniibacter pectenicola TaxID=1806669 RepID=UPI0008329EEE|nr:hypothetical protein [Neptuniibacter pectenicola]